MSNDWKLRVLDPDGGVLGESSAFLWVDVEEIVSGVGHFDFAFPVGAPILAGLANRGIVELWRKNAAAGVAWYCEFRGLYLGYRYYTAKSKADIFVGRCVGPIWLLSTRVNCWPWQDMRSSFINQRSETIAKTLVAYNCTGAALASAGRVRDGAITGVTFEGDAGRGALLDFSCLDEMLLDALQRLLGMDAFDFDMIYTAPAGWEFRYYPGQRGTDRSASVVFSLEVGNMTAPELALDRRDEKTVAIVAGAGPTNGRPHVVVNGADYAADNNIESYAPGAGEDSTAGMQAVGALAMSEQRARRSLAFSMLQTPGCVYGRDYFLGDLVSGSYRGATATVKVDRVRIKIGDGGPNSCSADPNSCSAEALDVHAVVNSTLGKEASYRRGGYLERLGLGILRQAAAPASGAWSVGDLVYNSAPALGSPVGWVCTTAGSPGTWRGFGVVV